MKFVKLLLVLFLVVGTRPSEAISRDLPELPENACAGLECSVSMLKVIDKIRLFPPVSRSQDTVYSGECHHLARGNNPERQQHGVILLAKDEQQGNVFFNGKFAFFHSENPYRDWTVEQALQEFSDPYRVSLRKTDEYSVADFTQPDSRDIWVYFMTEDREEGVIYVVAYWTVFHLMTCTLQMH